MKLSIKAEEIKNRYLNFGITESQLEEYKNLEVINEDEFEYIKMLKNLLKMYKIYKKYY